MSNTTINDLPEESLIEILSKFTTPEAARTSLVAPSWRYLWHHVPVLDFDMEKYVAAMPRGVFHSRDLRRLFTDLVNQTLFNTPRKYPLEAFKLHYYYVDLDFCKLAVNSWLKFALSCKPENLYLWVPPHSGFSHKDGDEEEEVDDYDVFFTPYVLDVSCLANSSIAILNLNGCRISCPSGLVIGSVREMHMTDVVGDIEQLIASCVNLQILHIWIELESDLQSLAIVSPNLIRCHLDNLPGNKDEMVSFKLDAPKLESVHFFSLGAKKFEFTNAPLATAYVCSTRWWDSDLIRFISGVKSLHIENKWTRAQFMERSSSDGENNMRPLDYHVELQLGEAVLSKTFAFRHLEHLTLRTCYHKMNIFGLQIILSKCPLLKTLFLFNDHSTLLYVDMKEQEDGEIDGLILDVSHLRLVKMFRFQGTRNERKVAQMLQKCGPVLEKIVAYPVKQWEPPFVFPKYS